MVRHGLSVDTAKTIALQLASERLDRKVGWKRAAILDRVQFDLFRSVYRRLQPQLATFFINSTAHFQHVYWRDMEPEHFQIQPDPAHRAQHEKSILFGYQAMDRLVGQTLELAGPDTTVVFCTALSQQPCTIYEEKGGKTFFRARDFAQFLPAVGITAPCKVAPVMSQQFHLDFETEEASRDAEAKLGALELADRGRVMYVVRKGTSVFAGCTIAQAVDAEARINIRGSDQTLRFFDLFYAVDLLKSGMHHRDGMFWIRTPAEATLRQPGSGSADPGRADAAPAHGPAPAGHDAGPADRAAAASGASPERPGVPAAPTPAAASLRTHSAGGGRRSGSAHRGAGGAHGLPARRDRHRRRADDRLCFAV